MLFFGCILDCDPRVIHEDDEMTEAKDDPLGKLLLKLHKLKRGHYKKNLYYLQSKFVDNSQNL